MFMLGGCLDPDQVRHQFEMAYQSWHEYPLDPTRLPTSTSADASLSGGCLTFSFFKPFNALQLYPNMHQTGVAPFSSTYIYVFKYHVSCTDGKISVRIKIRITFIFRFHCHPIHLVVFVPVGLSSSYNIF